MCMHHSAYLEDWLSLQLAQLSLRTTAASSDCSPAALVDLTEQVMQLADGTIVVLRAIART